MNAIPFGSMLTDSKNHREYLEKCKEYAQSHDLNWTDTICGGEEYLSAIIDGYRKLCIYTKRDNIWEIIVMLPMLNRVFYVDPKLYPLPDEAMYASIKTLIFPGTIDEGVSTDAHVFKGMCYSIPRNSGRYPWGSSSDHAIRIPLTIKRVIFQKPATIVFWEDGTKTVVKCSEKDTFDKEKGLAMAMIKKLSGNKSKYYDIFKQCITQDEE